MLKQLLIILLLLASEYFLAQSQSTSTKPAVTSSSVQGKYSATAVQNLVTNLNQDTCLTKKFSVIFYLINDSAYSFSTPSLSAIALASYSLGDIMSVINTAFSRICVQFEHCKTVVIPDYEANKWKIDGNGKEILKTFYEKNVINVYLPESILPLGQPDIPEVSYTFPLPSLPIGIDTTIDAIIIEKTAALKPTVLGGFVGSSFLHVLGHYFGLPHTYDEKNPGSIPNPPPPNNANPPISTLEYVDHANIQNCLDHGDGFCDTEADSYPSAPSPTLYPRATVKGCGDAAGLKDGHGDFYILPTDNFMSHYKCRCRYSQQQYKYMAYMIMTRRLYLH